MKRTGLFLLCMAMTLMTFAREKDPCVTFRYKRLTKITKYINENPDPPPGCDRHIVVLCEANGSQDCKYMGQSPPPPQQLSGQGNDVNAQIDMLWEYVMAQLDLNVTSGSLSGTLVVGPTAEPMPFSVVWSTDPAGVTTCDIKIHYDDGTPVVPGTGG